MNGLMSRALWLIGVAVVGSSFTVPPAFSQDFYKGKSIMLYSGYVAGGVANDSQLAARFLGKHIPGNPNITWTSMPGANGIVLANYLYHIAKPDGLTIGMPGRGGYLLAAMTGDKSVKYDLSKFRYFGSSGIANDILWLRKGINIRSVDQLLKTKQPIVIGGLGATTPTVIIPMIFAHYKTLPLRVVPGYPGTNETNVAMERGEIDGVFNAASEIPPDMLASGAVVPIMQAVPLRPDLPTFDSVITNKQEKAVMHLAVAANTVGGPLLGPPGLPDKLTTILRRAYTEMVNSPDYKAAAAKALLDVSKPYSGEALQKFVITNMTGISPDTIKEYLSIVGTK